MKDMGKDLQHLRMGSLMRICQMCDMYECPLLQVAAEISLAQMFTQRNVAELFQFAHLFNCAKLLDECSYFIMDNLVYQLENR
jgi:hypothetical protein